MPELISHVSLYIADFIFYTFQALKDRQKKFYLKQPQGKEGKQLAQN